MLKSPLITPDRLEFAAEIFLAEARKAEIKLSPMRMPKAQKLSAYSDIHRAMLMSAIKKAILAASPESDKMYQAWQAKKVETGE